VFKPNDDQVVDSDDNGLFGGSEWSLTSDYQSLTSRDSSTMPCDMRSDRRLSKERLSGTLSNGHVPATNVEMSRKRRQPVERISSVKSDETADSYSPKRLVRPFLPCFSLIYLFMYIARVLLLFGRVYISGPDLAGARPGASVGPN